MTAGVRARVVGRAFCAREASARRVAKSPKESPGFNKNIKKSGPLTMGVRGLDSSSPSLYYCSYSSLIYIYQYKGYPPIYKEVLILLSLQVFPLWIRVDALG